MTGGASKGAGGAENKTSRPGRLDPGDFPQGTNRKRGNREAVEILPCRRAIGIDLHVGGVRLGRSTFNVSKIETQETQMRKEVRKGLWKLKLPVD